MSQENITNYHGKGQATYAYSKTSQILNLSDGDSRAAILTMFREIKDNIHKMNENERNVSIETGNIKQN